MQHVHIMQHLLCVFRSTTLGHKLLFAARDGLRLSLNSRTASTFNALHKCGNNFVRTNGTVQAARHGATWESQRLVVRDPQHHRNHGPDTVGLV